MESMKSLAVRRPDTVSSTMGPWMVSKRGSNSLDHRAHFQRQLAFPLIRKPEVHLQLHAGRSLLGKFFRDHGKASVRNSIDRPNDPFEQEARRMEKLSVLKEPVVWPGLQPGQHVPKKSLPGNGVDGQPLPKKERDFFEDRFGHDFSKVRVHSGYLAEGMAREIGARAFTIGNHLFFGPGQYSPPTELGRRILAHELTHAIQQSKLISGVPLIQRTQLEYFVVGDPGLNAGGGTFLSSLSQIKARLMTITEQGSWTLVISIHGSEDRICDLAHPNNPDQECYDISRIQNLFGDSQFSSWRQNNGPSRVVLNACQVSIGLERAIINSLTRPQSGQSAQGLGEGCRPSTEMISVNNISTRAQYNRLSDPDKQSFQAELRTLNSTWGYFGAPPVPDDQILNYYFDVVPRGEWVIVRVSKDRVDTDIPFYNRGNNSEFNRLCRRGIAPLRDHIPSAPPLRSP